MTSGITVILAPQSIMPILKTAVSVVVAAGEQSG